MRPFSVMMAILFGSATATTFGLFGVLVVFTVLQGRHPEFSDELWPLVRSSLAFLTLSAVSGAALFATLKGLSWRRGAQLASACVLAAIVWIYWP